LQLNHSLDIGRLKITKAIKKTQHVAPKKWLGQHFLVDFTIAKQIADLLSGTGGYSRVIEIGAGTGALTQFLFPKIEYDFQILDIDPESINFLHQKYPDKKDSIQLVDFLNMPFEKEMNPTAIIGNFPYNISSQIFFRVLENPLLFPEVVGMLQKEVAIRLASKPGNKDYGILSVLLQAWYQIEYCFTVDEHVFDPPPKVKSGVIRLQLQPGLKPSTPWPLFHKVVKAAFNQRRKTLRNALSAYLHTPELKEMVIFNKRAEQLSFIDFENIVELIKDQSNGKSEGFGH